MNYIETVNLKYVYKDRKKGEISAINNFTAEFPSEKFNVIVGYSGCGKTTLLKVIAGLYDEYEGELYIGGENAYDLTIAQRDVSFVSQDFTLYPHLTVFDNIAFPQKKGKFDREEIVSRVIELADMLDLKVCLTRKPKHLSIGQQQRVAIARALVKHPKICLLDEPFSNVDPTLRAKARVTIKNTLKKYKCTTVYVTHDFEEAVAIADRLFVMNEGRLDVCGAPQEVYSSDSPIVAALKAGTL